MPRLFRVTPDSSHFERPRVLSRVFCPTGGLREAVRFYEQLTGQSLDMHLDARELGIHIAAVGSFLILDLDTARLDRSEQALATPVSIIFAHLDEALTMATAEGCEIIARPFPVPTGRGARVRHADGLLVEYLEHRASPDDVDLPSI